MIGDAPSFPAMLGVIPTTPGAMSGSAVPDTVLDGAEVAGVTIRGASLRGEDHRSQGVVRQDSMGIWRVNDGTMAAVLVCVTDGVSSQPHSHRGAVAVCQLLRDLAQHQVSRFFRAEPGKGLEILWEYMAEQLSAQLSELAVRQNMEPVTLSTTLAAAFIEENPADPAERRYVILNVGDATAFVLRGGEFTECLTDPHEGPVTESRTWTLPTGIGPVGTAAGVIGPRDMLMVCSDGMSNPMRNGDVQEQLAQWWGGDRVPDLTGVRLAAQLPGQDRTATTAPRCVSGAGEHDAARAGRGRHRRGRLAAGKRARQRRPGLGLPCPRAAGAAARSRSTRTRGRPIPSALKTLVDLPGQLQPSQRDRLHQQTAWPLARVYDNGTAERFPHARDPRPVHGTQQRGRHEECASCSTCSITRKPLWGDIVPAGGVSSQTRIDVAREFTRAGDAAPQQKRWSSATSRC